MPGAHPLAALRSAGPAYAETAEEQLRAALTANRYDVAAAGAALTPPVHRVTMHGWITEWGLREWLDQQRAALGEPPAKAAKPSRAKKSTAPRRKGLARQ